MSGDQMPKDQQEYIDSIQKYALEATNMKENEAYDFAFRCWQLDFEHERLGISNKKEFLNFLGRGSCFNQHKEGSTSAFYIDCGGMLLIDCGETTFCDLMKHSYLLENIDHIFILVTHMHTDHIGSIPSLIYYAYFVLNIKVTIFCCDAEKMRRFINGTMYTNMEEYKEIVESDKLHIVRLYPHRSFTIVMGNDDLNISPHCVFDIIPIPEDHMDDSMGYIISKKVIRKGNINSEINTIYYSGDTKAFNIKDILYHAVNIDYFYLDAANRDDNYPHQSIKSILETAKEYNIPLRKIRCMHIDDDTVIKEGEENGLTMVSRI